MQDRQGHENGQGGEEDDDGGDEPRRFGATLHEPHTALAMEPTKTRTTNTIELKPMPTKITLTATAAPFGRFGS